MALPVAMFEVRLACKGEWQLWHLKKAEAGHAGCHQHGA
jgi:hypothetical protein